MFKQIKSRLVWGIVAVSMSASAFSSTPEISNSDTQPLMEAISIVHHFYYKPTAFDALFKGAAKGMLAELDPHSAFLSRQEMEQLKIGLDGRYVGIGIEVALEKSAIRVIAPLDGSPAKKAGIQAGDLILRVNGRLVHLMPVDDVIGMIRGKPGTSVSLTIMHVDGEKPETVKVVRKRIVYDAVKSKLITPHYGYARITSFQGNVGKNLKKAISQLKRKSGQLKGFILDLRSNPGGVLTSAVDVSSLFLTPKQLKRFNGRIVSIKGRLKQSNQVYRSKGSLLMKGVPLVVLINGASASASEIVAGAIQDYRRGLVLGTRSFGKGSVQTLIPTQNGAGIKITTALYYTPAGHQIQAHGVTPSVYVPALSVKKDKSEAYFRLEESDFGNHVKNNDKESHYKQREREAMKHNTLLKLAQTDSQLYQAVGLLESLSAHVTR